MTASSADALNALGSDLAFSVSFSIANEIRASATSSGMSDDELISIILVVSILLEGIPLLLDRCVDAVSSVKWTPVLWRVCGCGEQGVDPVTADEFSPALSLAPQPAVPDTQGVDEHGSESERSDGRTIVAFVRLLLDIARRIAISLTIQMVAASVSARQPLRMVRILTLFSVAVFFLFLQNAAQTVSVASRQSRNGV